MTNNYREIIYARYTSQYMTEYLVFDQSRYDREAVSLQKRLEKWLPADKTANILDVACGAGQFLYFLNKKGYINVAGVDVSPEQVEISRKVCSNVVLTDALVYLTEHKNTFDLITGFDVIEHFQKSELFPMLDALHGALKPGGRLILQTPNAESPWGMKVRYGDLTHELAFEPTVLKRTLAAAGFDFYEARECGPYAHGFISFVRCCVWQTFRQFLKLWNLAEVGNAGSGIYTRVFVAKADKRV
jgi:2-polyprenyl-3-methyl-5-hydroxy-6-metoxy-1,4-benzoquinol methylase